VEKVLISACLLGEPVRYNGEDRLCDHEIMQRWIREGRVVPVCPEIAGGLGVPRLPAEIVEGAGGAKVLAGDAMVIDKNGNDVSSNFVAGARHALASARASNIRVAVLKEGSPSCGSGFIYDGTFTSTRVQDAGVTAALLRESGIRVFSEFQLAEAEAALTELESMPPDTV
jgi:uncharacterized protein YbbK (DUF523 family)